MIEDPKLPLPPKRAVSLTRIEKMTDKLVAGLRKWWGTEPEGEDFLDFVRDVHDDLPKTQLQVIYLSLMHLTGAKLDRQILTREMFRLAGNYDQLKLMPVPPWSAQSAFEWAPVMVCEATQGINNHIIGCWYEIKILAGTAVGKRFTIFWSKNLIRFNARKIGFTGFRARPQLLMANYVDLVGLRFYVCLDPKYSRDDRPGFRTIYCHPSYRVYNRVILKQRYRITPCPLKYLLSDVVCRNCNCGYESCIAGTHHKDWESKFCPNCKEQSWFDPARLGNICVSCDDKRRKGQEG